MVAENDLFPRFLEGCDTVVRLADSYLELNAQFGSPVAYSLGNRGFYTEVNDVLNIVVYCLVHGRRLVVDQSQFGGFRWSNFFDTDLPRADTESESAVPPEARITGPRHPLFLEIQRWVERRYRYRVPMFLSEMDFLGGLFGAKRQMAFILSRPHQSGSGRWPFTGEFATFQVRSGDRTDIAVNRPADAPLSDYLGLLQKHASHLKSVFVMTDDFSVVEELRTLAPALRFESFCHATDRGFDPSRFAALSVDDRILSAKKVVSEVEIATQSAVFIGPFCSSLSRYVTLRHRTRKMCFSVDNQKSWVPSAAPSPQ